MDTGALRLEPLPELRSPILLAAFAGWNDASQVATHALETIVQAWSAQRIGEIDPEEFFDFSETRPEIRITPGGSRQLEWPENLFYAHQLPQAEHDLLMLIGTEPNVRWRTFCDNVMTLARRLDASCLVTIGGMLSDVPHTVEPRLTGFATSAQMMPQLQQLGVRMSSYEGPTGIVGVLHDAWQGLGRPALSLWGHVPHYISASPNPLVSLALLQRVGGVLGVDMPLRSLEMHARAFSEQIEEALEQNPEAAEYVRKLEQTYDSETPTQPSPGLIQELEEFLRNNRPDEDGDGENLF